MKVKVKHLSFFMAQWYSSSGHVFKRELLCPIISDFR